MQSCESVLKELETLQGGMNNAQTPLPPVETLIDSGKNDNYDAAFAQQIHQAWRILAWIPFVHILYLAGGLLKQLKSSAQYIFLALFYFSSIVLIGAGLHDRVTFFWGSGIFIFVLVYLYALILRLSDKEIAERLKEVMCSYVNAEDDIDQVVEEMVGEKQCPNTLSVK